MHHKGDFSFRITNFFFKTIRIIIEKFISWIWIWIRKGKLQGINLLEKDVKYKPNLEQLLKGHIGYIDFKHIRIYLDYLQQMHKHIFAMIWQLGPPTFCVTYTSAEHCWNLLVEALTKLLSNRRKREHIETIEEYNIDYLVRNDPVTCTHYYRHKTDTIKQFVCEDNMFSGKILDYYFVNEFKK